jgi:large subunit ribosomal protein L25
MKVIFISGSPRASVGKKDSKALRVQGLVPCVLYGGKEQVHFSAKQSDFKPLLFTPEVHTVELEVAGAKYNAILQDVQFHNLKDHILHVDFFQVSEDKPVIIGIPVKLEGVAPGVREGGNLVTKMRKLKVRALLKDLPDFITIDISKLAIGQSVKIGELKNSKLTFIEAPNVVVVAVTETRASKQAADEAAKK